MNEKTRRLQKKRKKFQHLSIRHRIFMYFLMFTALLLTLLWVFQTILLDDFYKYQKSAMLTSSAESLARNIENEDIFTLAHRISEENDVCILMVNQRMQTLISVDASSGCVLHSMSRTDLLRSMRAMQSNDEIIFHIFPMRNVRSSQYDAERFSGYVPSSNNGNMKSMIAARRVQLSGGSYIYIFLDANITPVTATVETLRNQLLFITGVLVLFSFLISLLLTRHITQPIVETTLAARSLPQGEFHPNPTRITYREVEELNRQLTQAAQDLRKVEALQRELIANISHDLRTPLTLIEGYAEAVRDLPGENTGENMQVIIDEAKRLTTLVNAVLDYSLSKDGAAAPAAQTFDLTESIFTTLKRYQKLIEQDGYQIHFDYDAHVSVYVDELKIGQVIYNLINNALTYTGADKTVLVTQSVEGQQVKIAIHDSGSGISPEDLPHIWSRYYRGNKPHKRAAIGTGLGLSIVQSILESYQLPYGVESAEGLGSTFWFLLPVADP